MATFNYPSNCVERLPDMYYNRYRFPFKVLSDSNPNKTYTISYDNAPNAGHWTCSCRGNIGHGHCKHLEEAGLHGRKWGKSVLPDGVGIKGDSVDTQAKRLRATVAAMAGTLLPIVAKPRHKRTADELQIEEDAKARTAAEATFAATADDEVLAMLGA